MHTTPNPTTATSFARFPPHRPAAAAAATRTHLTTAAAACTLHRVSSSLQQPTTCQHAVRPVSSLPYLVLPRGSPVTTNGPVTKTRQVSSYCTSVRQPLSRTGPPLSSTHCPSRRATRSSLLCFPTARERGSLACCCCSECADSSAPVHDYARPGLLPVHSDYSQPHIGPPACLSAAARLAKRSAFEHLFCTTNTPTRAALLR